MNEIVICLLLLKKRGEYGLNKECRKTFFF
jgi:hypothetical protein